MANQFINSHIPFHLFCLPVLSPSHLMSSNSKTHYGESNRYLLVWKQHYQCFSMSLLLSSHLQRSEASRYIDCTHRYQTHLQRRADSWRQEDMRGEQAAEELLCRSSTFEILAQKTQNTMKKKNSLEKVAEVFEQMWAMM